MTYLVDVYHTYSHTFRVEAGNRSAAIEKAYRMDATGKFDEEDFHKCDDSTEIECHGYIDKRGEEIYD